MPYCIIFNGAARSGKGVAAKHMKDLINSQDGNNLRAFHMEFKDELFKLTSSMLGITVDEFLEGYDLKTNDWFGTAALQDYDTYYCGEYRWFKDYPLYVINGKKFSKRQALIHMSEGVIKPTYGNNAFGKALVEQLPEDGVVFVSDSGFKEELQPVIDHVGHENVLVLRIKRDGCTFEGDSRNYLCPSMFPDATCPLFRTIENNGTLDEFYSKVEKVVGDWL